MPIGPLQRILVLLGLVREAATDVIVRNHAIFLPQIHNQMAVVKGPCRIAMDHDYRLSPTLVQVVVSDTAQIKKTGFKRHGFFSIAPNFLLTVLRGALTLANKLPYLRQVGR